MREHFPEFHWIDGPLDPYSVAQAAMPPVLLAALLDRRMGPVSGNECGGGRVGFCPRLPPLFQQFDGTVDGAFQFRGDGAPFPRSLSFPCSWIAG